MTVETELGRLRVGETRDKPRGGVVADTPFAEALHELAVSRGYETQTSLSRALGKKNNTPIRNWYVAKQFPDPEQFGALLGLLKPNDQELEKLVVPWAEHLSRTGPRGGETRFKISVGNRKPNGELEKIIDRITKKRGLTLKEFCGLLDLPTYSMANLRSAGINMMSEILARAPTIIGMTREETEELSEEIAKVITNRIANGHRFQNNSGRGLKKIQALLNCKTYNGAEAAEQLKVTRETIRLKRKELGFPILLTREQLELVEQSIKKLAKKDLAGAE